jgi:hypothetical protein
MRQRPLGNPTNKAWLAGWDGGIIGSRPTANPYVRRPQRRAWEDGRQAGWLSTDEGVALMKRRANQARPGTYL